MAGSDYSIEGYDSIELFSTQHTKESKGIKIHSHEKTIVFTSDTGPIKGCNKIFFEADYLIHDCYAPSRFCNDISALDHTHTSAATLGKIAEESCVKHLVPIHFSGECMVISPCPLCIAPVGHPFMQGAFSQ